MRLEFDTDFNSEKNNWLFSLDKVVVEKSDAVSNEVDLSKPSNFTLSQNYPNPFNPSTQITFSLPEQGNVVLQVFNMLGQSVQILVNEMRSAGQHTVPFDASHLSSGVYVYQLEFDGKILSNKMILMK